MKKVILAQARVAEDKQTKERLVFVTFINLPTKTSQGKVWYPKSDDLCTISCFGEDRTPALFGLLRKAVPGTLCGVTFGVNDYTGKTYIADVEILKEGYTESDIYERSGDGTTTSQTRTDKPKKSLGTAMDDDGEIPM